MPRLPGVETQTGAVAHVDMDCFYAACERLREPRLRGEPVVVGMGYEPGETHGAVATASYEARAQGVESAMAISAALELVPRCRDRSKSDDGAGSADAEGEVDGATDDEDRSCGFYRPVDMSYYESVSQEVQAVCASYAETLRVVSIDEAYLDFGDVDFETAADIGRELKAEIESEAGVVPSVGIAPNMATAKLASDAEKPDGFVVVPPTEVRSFLAPLPVEDLHGVGPVTARELRGMGLETAGDVAAATEPELVDAFGERGRELHAQARGVDPREVEPRGRPKSLSSESAFHEPTADVERKRTLIRELATEVTQRAATQNALYKTIGVKVVQPPFDVSTRERSLSGPIDDPELVESIACELLEEFEEVSVRKLGVRVSNLSFDDRKQAQLATFEGDADGSEDGGARSTGRQSGGQTDLTEFSE
ncbi:MAG: DNA polymerase IV [Natronomonas sp.]